MAKVVTHVRIEPEMKRLVEMAAGIERRTVSAWILLVIEEELARKGLLKFKRKGKGAL